MEESYSDPNPFNLFKKNSSKSEENEQAAEIPQTETPTPKICVNPNELFYDMSGEKHLIIFNHRTFERSRHFGPHRPDERKGTDEDVRRLIEVFGDILGFKVGCHHDKSYSDLWQILKNVSNQDYSSVSCLCIVILTHGGNKSELFAADRPYYLTDVIKLFEGHPTLAAKPKLFFIQACRGRNKDAGVRVVTDGHPRCEDKLMVVPSHLDFLIMRSSVEDYVSWRTAGGSWLIQELCNFIQHYYWDLDLLRIITLINKEIAFKYETFSRNAEDKSKKQIPETTFTLTKFLKFPVSSK